MPVKSMARPRCCLASPPTSRCAPATRSRWMICSSFDPLSRYAGRGYGEGRPRMDRNFSINRYFENVGKKHRPRYRFAGTTRADFDQWHAALHPQVVATLGRMPAIVPLNPEIEAEWTEDNLLKQRIVFDVEEGLSVTALLFRPQHATGKLPAIICCHGHTA